MLRITADLFSGRPNPSWVVSDETEVQATLREFSKDRALVHAAVPATAGLGFRGLSVDILNDEAAPTLDLPTTFYLPIGTQVGRAQELAERLIGHLRKAELSFEVMDQALEGNLHDFLTQQLHAPISARVSVLDSPTEVRGAVSTESEAAIPHITCTIELSPYNPGFWNNNPTILHGNNCYNYASNKRTDTFAQPGRGCGHMYTAITCPAVTQAALCDGLHHRFNCFPDSEKPRYLVALVIAPGPGFVDFHWYRKMKEGFWGHKPGGTPVRNVDNSGHVITNPQTCNRGPYTQFCGYFYTCRSQRIR